MLICLKYYFDDAKILPFQIFSQLSITLTHLQTLKVIQFMQLEKTTCIVVTNVTGSVFIKNWNPGFIEFLNCVIQL